MPEVEFAHIALRPATLDDCLRIWEWRNDPENRKFFFDSSDIPFEDHERWFLAKIQAQDTQIFVAIDEHSREVGYVRFSILRDQAEISVALGNPERGKGYGTAAIKQASDQILASGDAKRIVAQVKHDNPSSIAAFQRAGFSIEAANVVADNEIYQMVYAGTN